MTRNEAEKVVNLRRNHVAPIDNKLVVQLTVGELLTVKLLTVREVYKHGMQGAVDSVSVSLYIQRNESKIENERAVKSAVAENPQIRVACLENAGSGGGDYYVGNSRAAHIRVRGEAQ